MLFNIIFNLTVSLYKLLNNNLGLAVIAIAILSRLITLPVLIKQMSSNDKIRDIKPRLDKLKKKYKGNQEKLNEETLKLYKEAGINPIGGCLPLIVQLIFLVQVRKVVVSLVADGVSSFNNIAFFDFLKFSDDHIVDLNFLGLRLDKVAADFSWSESAIIPYVILAVIVGLTQLFSAKFLTPSMSEITEEKKVKDGEDRTPSFENMSVQMNKQMMYFLPITTVIMALGYSGSSYFSAAMSIFWITQNTFVIVQRLIMSPKSRENLKNNFTKIFKKSK